MTDIKNIFNQWLIQTTDKNRDKNRTTPLTASEYINRLGRLSQRLLNKEDFQYLSNNIYILRLLFMDNSKWMHIENRDLDCVVVYLHNYKHKNRNFNDHYNQYIKSIKSQLNVPLRFIRMRPYSFFDVFSDYEEYLKLSKWIKYVFITDKSLKYLSWLYINKAERRKVATALEKFQEFLTSTKVVGDSMVYELCRQTLWLKRKNKSNDWVQIDEANGVEGRNFYSRYKEGKVEKLLSIQEAAQTLGCAESTIRSLIKKGKLHFKPNTNKIIAENIRRFLRRRHTKRIIGQVNQVDLVKDKKNWVKMKEAEVISRRSATYIRKKVKDGRVAYTRYGVRKFLYFVPDLRKI